MQCWIKTNIIKIKYFKEINILNSESAKGFVESDEQSQFFLKSVEVQITLCNFQFTPR